MLHFEHSELLSVYHRMKEHLRSGLPTLAPGILGVPVHTYTDPVRWSSEMDRIFRRKPLPLGLSAELREPGAFRALTVAGVRILIVRTGAGQVRAYVNACRHRGTPLVADGLGRAKRFTCGYHAWTYAADDGRLLAIPDADSFGPADKGCLGLTSLAAEEHFGLIWVVLTPGVPIDLDSWLGSMGALVSKIGLDQYEVFAATSLDGPNWKIVMEGYLETYHFAALHSNSFMPLIFGNMTLIDTFDSHLRLCTPMRTMADHVPPTEVEWDTLNFVQHSFYIFPTLQISFTVVPPGPNPVHMALVSQVFPGVSHDRSITIQRIITSRDVRNTPEEARVRAFTDLAFKTVQDEDYAITPTIQTTLSSNGNREFLFGRNEIGAQHLHNGLARYLAEHAAAEA